MQAIFARTAPAGCALTAALLLAAPAPGQGENSQGENSRGENGSATGVLRPFEAVYQVVRDKRQAKMSVSLQRVAEDVYAHDMTLSLFIIGTVRQTLMMRRTGDDLRPLYAAGGLGKRVESVDWDEGRTVFTNRKGEEQELAADGSEQAENAMQYDIGLKLAALTQSGQDITGWESTYKLSFDRGGSWTVLNVRVRDMRMLDTDMGEVECVTVSGASPDGKYRTLVYLAPSLHWMPVRYIRQGKDADDRRSSRMLKVKFPRR